MTYEITGYLDAESVSEDAEDLFQEWSASYNTLSDLSRYTHIPKRDDGTLQAYDVFAAHILYDENIDKALDDLINSTFSTADWLVVHRSHSKIEETDYINDETYFSPLMDTGLRTTPSFSIESPQVRSHDDIHYRIDGANYTVSGGSVDFSDIDISDGVELYATDEEELAIDGGGVLVAEVSNNAIIDRSKAPHIITEEFSISETEDSIHFVKGNPPTYFENPTESLPDRIKPNYFSRNYVSEESLVEIESKIESLDPENEDVKSVLNTISHILTSDSRFK
jgi:hypothetical protein